LDKTIVDYEVEKAAKEKRDRDEEVAYQTAEFERRSGERKEQYDEINGRLQTAKEDLQANLDDIQTW